jgi:hypothetical protein
MGMWPLIRTGLVIAAITVVCMPVSFFVTVLLHPLWRWIEARYGVEAIGHSGPAEWCFYLVLVLLLAPCLLVYWRMLFRPSKQDGA